MIRLLVILAAFASSDYGAEWYRVDEPTWLINDLGQQVRLVPMGKVIATKSWQGNEGWIYTTLDGQPGWFERRAATKLEERGTL